MNKEDVLKLSARTTALGFFIGLLFSFAAVKGALAHIIENRYLAYGMFRLAAAELQEPLFDWLTQVLAAGLALFLLGLLWRFLVSKTIELKLSVFIKDQKKLNTYVAVILSLIFLIYAEYMVNSKWASAGFNLITVLLNVGLLFLAFLLGWILSRIKWENLSRIIKLKYFVSAALFLTVLLLVLNAVIFIAARTGKKPRGPHIVLIVVDCLRPDHLGCYGYARETSPNMDDLARNGLVFQNAFSSAPWTKPAVASIFTSLYPNQHGVVNSSDALPTAALTLAEILKNRGYQTYFGNGGSPYLSQHFMFTQGFDSYISRNRAPALTEAFLNQLDNGQDRRFFAYLHYMDLHLPYYQNKYNGLFSKNLDSQFLRPGHMDQLLVRTLSAENSLSEKDKHYLEAVYDGQIRCVDEALKKLTAGLKEKNLLKNTVIIISADHGEEFWEHGNFEHGHSLYNELLHVPLIAAGTGVKPAKIDTPVGLVDLLPTILELAHIPTKKFAAAFQGKNLFGTARHPVFASATLYGDEKHCIIKDEKKLIFNTGNKGEKKPLIGCKSQEKFEVYDLHGDPFEKYNLSLKMSQELAKLRMHLERFLETAAPLKGKKITPTKELAEKLRSLGYL